MSGIDFLLMRTVGVHEMRDALAAVLDLSRGDVEIVRSIEESTGDTPLVVEVLEVKGDFSTHVAIYARPSVKRVGLPELRRITQALGTPALVPDSTPNPYSMVLVSPDGSESNVSLDWEGLDLRDEYRLARDAPGASSGA